MSIGFVIFLYYKRNPFILQNQSLFCERDQHGMAALSEEEYQEKVD
jgi:hypothetical protein